jgi:hypothetical protein
MWNDVQFITTPYFASTSSVLVGIVSAFVDQPSEASPPFYIATRPPIVPLYISHWVWETVGRQGNVSMRAARGKIGPVQSDFETRERLYTESSR